ncbi:hypothetical protein AND_006757 [Anopheles darlingi]|uniref:Uncharacterized protein n=1 Tax=Anopheles darlingi TaxID=43151 RepID=W5JFJ5_ANODA|nr:hypothetical protein AND_006757 [Anopheles darlingi]
MRIESPESLVRYRLLSEPEIVNLLSSTGASGTSPQPPTVSGITNGDPQPLCSLLNSSSDNSSTTTSCSSSSNSSKSSSNSNKRRSAPSPGSPSAIVNGDCHGGITAIIGGENVANSTPQGITKSSASGVSAPAQNLRNSDMVQV